MKKIFAGIIAAFAVCMGANAQEIKVSVEESAWDQPARDFQVVAHRGGALIGNENTLSAFATGMATGAEYIELDVHLTKDGEVVVCHDQTIDRTTDKSGQIDQMTLSEFKAARALDRNTGEPTDEDLPTLAEVFDLVNGQCCVLIEIKRFRKGQYADIEQKVLDIVNAYGMHDKVIVQSFDDEAIENTYALDPTMKVEKLIFTRLPFGLCFDGGITAFSFKKYDYCQAINPMGMLVGKRFVKDCHKHGKLVRIWTVNDPSKRIPGVDAVITNRPDLF